MRFGEKTFNPVAFYYILCYSLCIAASNSGFSAADGLWAQTLPSGFAAGKEEPFFMRRYVMFA